jgi:hypothetical protein
MRFILTICLLLMGAIRHDRDASRYEALALLPAFQAVGLVVADGVASGSAVLVSADWAVTASHVIREARGDSITIKLPQESLTVETVIFHPDADLALLHLSSSAQATRAATLNTRPDELGRQAVSVGFGMLGNGLQSMGEIFRDTDSKIGVKRAGYNRIDEIDDSGLLLADFDHPTDARYNMMGDASPLDLEYLPMPGDSGGGQFIQVDDTWVLAGITSGATTPRVDVKGDGNWFNALAYGHIANWTRVSSYAGWMEQIVEGRR